MSLQARLILFFFITSLGSALSSVATFLSIEPYFESLILLGVALSVRTLASAIFSYFSHNIIQALGLRNSLLASQIFGCLALLVLFIGFHLELFSVTLLGIVLTGLPSAFVAILLSIILRISSENSDVFRKYSGRRELIYGMAMLSASIFAPLLLLKFNLNIVLLMDSISYLIGLNILAFINFTEKTPIAEEKEPIALKKLIIENVNAKSFLIKTSASLLLAGLLPLLAASGKIQLTVDIPILIRQWLWAIEDVTAISASLLYLFFALFQNQKWCNAVLMISGIWLLIPLISSNQYSIIIAAAIICLPIDFSGQKFRDDLIVSAGSDNRLVKACAALAQFQRNFIFFISPIFLSAFLTYFSTSVCVASVISLQIFFFFIWLKLTKQDAPYVLDISSNA